MSSHPWMSALALGASSLLARPLKKLSLLSLIVLLGSCSDPHALLLTIKGQSFVETFDLSVKDLATGEIVLERRQEPVDAADPNRDISQPRQELKISVEFSSAGNYLIHFVGHTGTASQVALRDYRVDGVREESITLLPIVDGQDEDGDGFPVCGAYGDCVIAEGAVTCQFLDCDDTDANVHPFGTEVCGNGKDDDCDQGCGADPTLGDEQCQDQDGDGVAGSEDCDDNDPCRAPTIREAPNLCGLSAADFALPQACLDKLTAAGQTPPAPPFCGDGIDQSCSGGDVPCVVDEDCDGVSPPVDCNDQDATINPSAAEQCGDTVDNNCNGVINEGCAPCDVDGDNHAAVGLQDPNCTGADGQPLPTDDGDDYDAGVYPGASDAAGDEGGHKQGALREVCSRTKLSKDGVTFEADVDHDLDGQTAAQDGCPDPACDADGDGFRAATCNPPPPSAEEDCNDQDAHVFPGAPEVCGDGVDQSCSGADVPCTGDQDGDGYLPPDDCDDDDADVHPWATEVCDKADNDCDGLLNEGNPDHLGVAMPASVTCTDDNDGACGQQLGRCACTQVDPGAIDMSDRVVCAGEDLTDGATSPRCVGAGQPQPESCVQGEDLDCDEREDDPQGDNLADIGKVCGVSVGNCTPGQVVGCDFSRVVPNLSVIQAVQGDFNGFWVCSSETELPVPEVCNGKDDDCNGVIPNGEIDAPPQGDNDGYLACTGCSIGTGRLDLSGQYTGCADCDATNSAIYPTQTEFCNNVDDNCVNGTNDDGAGQCTTNQKCCSSQRACRDVLTDAYNCGDCGVNCTTRDDTDVCVGGNCACGSTGGPCPAGLDCVSGQCRCISGGRCGGCCADSSTCVTFSGQSTAECGRNGASCADCGDGNECTTDQCSSGVCSNTDRSDGTGCDSGTGQCREGDCCNGCWDSSLRRCLIGSDQSASRCGDDGVICVGCTTSNECETPTCSSERCTYPDKSDTTLCSGGQCRAGNCCTGCWNSSATQCLVGGAQSTALCGDDGNTCQACTTSNECQQPVCSGERCTTIDRTDGLTCNSGNGKCRDGNCCSGCWSVLLSSCLGDAAQSTAACGDNGDACGTCTSANECRVPVCVGGVCSTTPKSDGASCAGGNGECQNGNCCTGCWNGSSCVDFSSQSVGVCGDNGVDCAACTAPNACLTPVCTATGCSTVPIADCCLGDGDCSDGDICTDDRCVSNRCTFPAIANCCVNSGDCNDGDVCTDDVCISNRCSNPSIANCCYNSSNCDDGDVCTLDQCNSNRCANPAISNCCIGPGDCNDGDICTDDNCVSNQCENPAIANCCTGPSDCNDGDECTDDVCSTNTCSNPPLTGTGCNSGTQVCVDGVCCGGCWRTPQDECVALGDQTDSECGVDGEGCTNCGGDTCVSGVCTPP